MRKRPWIPFVGIALFVLLAGLQILTSWLAAREVQAAVAEVRVGADAALAEAKTAEEVIAARIERRKQSLFWHQLNTGLGPFVSIVGAVLGGLVAWRSYLDTRSQEQEARRKDQLARLEAVRKERVDRGASELKEVLELLVSAEVRKQVVGAVSLQHFLTKETPEHHRRALVALAAAARFEKTDSEVLRGLRLAAEAAFAVLEEEELRAVSWQGVRLADLRCPGRSLGGLDFTDAQLERADFSDGDLTGTTFRNAALKGARFERAILDGVDFTYADLAGADFRNARLGGAMLADARIADLDLAGADLSTALFDPAALPFDRTRHWRRATLAPEARRRLEEKYGAEPSGPRVVMLLWEFPPYVAGGTWTAAYHLVRCLRRAGADLRVVVPWAAASRIAGAFGTDVEVLNLGLSPPEPTVSPYGGGPYGGGGVYGFAGAYARGNAFGGTYATGSGSSALRLQEEFRRRLLADERLAGVDLVHAHDWITFDAAESLASRLGVPWVAHFHSLESDRRGEGARDPVLAAIEARATRSARAIVTPSRFTAEKVVADYGAAPERLHVVPNPVSPEPAVTPGEMGRFESRRVVFSGRLTSQKGPDRFRAIGEELCRRLAPPPNLVVFGAGEEEALFRFEWAFELAGALPWAERGRAFAGASAVVVPSRSEPFGLVVLEAMRHRVPVFLPLEAGVREVADAGIAIDPAATGAVAAEVARLLGDWPAWERVVEQQAAAYDRHLEASREQIPGLLFQLWRSVLAPEQTVSPPL